ncbi:TPA: hypothetical protein P1L68_004594 [Escherichia coli]|nr:hypothetical protein [Escherichia coli]HDN3059323.1 hypothetical protein [Escherichia coli]
MSNVQTIAITEELEAKCIAWTMGNDPVAMRKFPMKITDIEAFKDAQLMARIAVSNLSNSIPADAFWFAAMQTLKAAYAGEKK